MADAKIFWNRRLMLYLFVAQAILAAAVVGLTGGSFNGENSNGYIITSITLMTFSSLVFVSAVTHFFVFRKNKPNLVAVIVVNWIWAILWLPLVIRQLNYISGPTGVASGLSGCRVGLNFTNYRSYGDNPTDETCIAWSLCVAAATAAFVGFLVSLALAVMASRAHMRMRFQRERQLTDVVNKV